MLDYFRILQGLQIDEGSLVVTGTIDPSVTGYAADEGSLFMRNNAGAGQLWLKTGVADTAWSPLGTSASNAYTTITGDVGSATAVSSTDTLNFTGVGITTSAAEGAPDSVTLTLAIADLSAGVGPLVVGDEIAVNDGGTTLRFTFTDVVEDLNIVYGITSDGILVRTADDVYTSRSVVASTTAGLEGTDVVNGNGVAGNITIGVDITGQVASSGDMIATDEFLGFDGLNNVKFTGQQIADGVTALISIGNAYTTITGDAGSATASTSTDTLNFTGVGITTSVANGAPDAVTLTLSIADLVAGVGPLVLGDEIAVNDGGTTLRFTFTDVVEDLDIPYGITTDGILVRTAADTYASRSIVASITAGLEGADVVDGNGVAGNPTIGVDINNLVSSGVDLDATDELIVFDGTNNLSYTGQQIADGVETLLGGPFATLSFVTIATPAGGPVVADTSADTLTFTQSTGIAITGTAGTDTINFAPANDLAAVEALATTGFAVRTGVETWTTRSLVAPAAGITITNPDGVAGNPTFALANDLAALEGLAGTGIAVRSAADTWVQRTITASVDEDNLGASVVNGDGVAGNPTVGVTIVTLTDPGADMAAADEFIVHDKSEGTGGANRKITGQNISDGVFFIAGFTGFTMSTINGQLVPTFTDTTRANKQLSFAESVVNFAEETLSDNDWMDVGDASNALTGHIVPLTGTIVRATFHCEDDNGFTKALDLYINGVLNSTLFTTSGSSAEQSGFNAALNIDVAQGDKVQMRAGTSGDSIEDTVVDLWIKWRA